MLADQLFQAMLANIAFHLRSVTKYGFVSAGELNVVELLRFKIVSGKFALADIAYHRFGFLNHLLNVFVLDHRGSNVTWVDRGRAMLTCRLPGAKRGAKFSMIARISSLCSPGLRVIFFPGAISTGMRFCSRSLA